MDRRSFLLQASGTMTAAALPWQTYATSNLPQIPICGAGLSKQQWQTLAAVQEHLFPSELDAPGAKDINASNYLLSVLTAPDFKASEREFIQNGIIQLEKTVKNLQYQPFISLSISQKETALSQLETEPNGKQWLRAILEYILEALLSDPIYGGNPNGIGWQWLEHQAGFPRPPENRKYYQL